MKLDDIFMFENYKKHLNEIWGGPADKPFPTTHSHKETFKDVYEAQILELENTLKDLEEIILKLDKIGVNKGLITHLKMERNSINKTTQQMILDLKNKISDHGHKETGKVIKSKVIY